MRRTHLSRVLSLVLALVMVLSMFPVPARAAETATWTKVDAADITADDTIMVTMTNPSSVTYALHTVPATKGPLAKVVTVDGDTITTEGSADYGWTVTPVDGGYTLSVGESYLYTINDNNGVRIGDTAAVWAIDGTYLSTTDTGGNTRWLGVYDNNNGDYSAVATPNWRAYKNTTGNTKNQTLGFWKLTESSGTTDPTDPSEPVETDPTEPAELPAYVLTDTIAAGDVVLVYNASSSTVLTSTASGYKLAGLNVTPAEGVIETDQADAAWTVGVSEDGTYTFTQGDMVLGMVQSGSYVNLSTSAADGYTAWTIEDSTTETVHYLRNTNMPAGNYGPYYLEYYSGYTAYASNSPSDSAFGMQFYKLETEAAPEGFVLSGTVAAGDEVILYNAGNSAALSSTASGYKLAGETVTPVDSVIDTENETLVWTVGVNADGTCTFTQGDMVLGMVQSGSYVNLSTNAADGYTAWTIEDSSTENIHYLRNTNMPAGNYGPYYLEYYGGFTAYASNSPSDAAYGIEFYVRGGSTVTPDPDPDPTDPTDPTEPEDPEVPEGTVATLVTDLSALELGDEIILVAPNNSVAMSVNNGNYFNPADVTMGEGVVYFGEDVQTLILESGLTDGTYALNASGYYLCAVSGSSNYLKQEASVTAFSSWTIEIAADGIATIKSTGDTERNWIRYNPTSPRFSCYRSGQNDVAIYKVERDQYAELTNELSDGDAFVIYYPKESTVISTTASGNKLTGVAAVPENDFLLVEDGMAVLTADLDENGYYTLTNAEGLYLTCGATGNSLTFEDVPSDYSLWLPEQTEGGWFIRSVNAVYGGYAQYIEVYNSLFTTFSLKETSDPSYYTMQFYALTDKQPSVSGKPSAGDQVVIYNLAAEGVLAAENDTQSIENALTAVENGVAIPANGGVVFTVEENGTYHRFYNETYGYLCSNGTGNNAFYTTEASEDADWILLTGKSGGWNMESRTAKYNGTYSQYLEYYADSYKTYSMYNVTDYDIYEFFFYPVAEGVNLSGAIVNQPTVDFGTLSDAYVGVDYKFTVTVDAVFGVETMTVMVNDQLLQPSADGSYYLIGGDMISGESLTITVEGVDTLGVAFSGTATVKVVDEPSITDVSPAAGEETLENKRPTISAVLINEGENAVVTMTVGGEAVDAVYTPAYTEIDGLTAIYHPSSITWTPAADLADGRTTVTVTVTRADGKTAVKTWSFTVGEAQYALYFGQLHSHTTYSDGSGSLESALDYIASLPESANVDFVAFTDHSNYFDTSSSANPEQALYDMSLASSYSQDLWSAYKGAIAEFNAKSTGVIAIGGFEMTWSGGPGHINTFATNGIVSRNNTTLNNKTSDAGMKAYYALISQAEGAQSISQFNHPGTTFGNFTDFAYWDALVDTRMYLVEVGNGEGQIGAGGYYPSYEQYTMALDKGWHVAPTNNQDNHKGKWGNANDARDVVLTDDFSEEGIYEAIRNYRVYATEDKNLEIGYTVNGEYLGSIIEEVPEALNLEVTVYDPDAADSVSKVEVIVNSGKVAHTWDDPADLATGVLTATLAPDYSYYYIRVTQGDGELAVTAPVWVGETLKLGISAVECGTATPVTGEELTISTTLFNSETTDASVKSLTYTVGSQVLAVDTTGYTIPASGNTTVSFAYTPDVAKVMNVTVTVVVELDGVEYTFSMDVELDVQDASKLVYIGIDASHYNEYVNGNYKDSMGNFGNLAAEYSVRTVTLNTSEDLIAACSNEKYVALILTAPSRRNGNALRDPYATYSDEEIAALKAFNTAGGALILTGWGDYYESYADFPAEDHMAAQQNKILQALGSSLRIADDETKDDTHNGGQSQRLYLSVYDFDSFLLDGVEYDAENPHNNMYTELYSQYGGASIYVVDGQGNPTASVPATVTPAVYGFDTTYSADDDGDSFGGLGQTQKYTVGETEHLMVLASEQLEGQGLIVVAGAAFLSNFEVQATIEDSGAEKNYSNYKICENLLTYLNPVVVTDIAEVQAQTDEGVKYTIEGVVTSNASGYDKDTAFFDCIYLQDATAGINAFPVAGNYKIGDKVRITGTTSSYQGERQIAVTSIELISEGNMVEPTVITASQLNDGSVLGSLVTLKGTVESFEYANSLVQTIMVKDSDGNVGRVFIDGYITTSYDVENLAVGCEITVTGLASYDNSFDGPAPRIRIRDRKDVVCAAHVHAFGEWVLTTEPTCTAEGEETRTCACGETEKRAVAALGHTYESVVTAPTCTEKGYTTYTCSVCGDSYTADETPATGHTFSDWTVTTEPTCTDEGEETRTCHCGETEKRAVAALGHDWHGLDCSRCDAVRENPYVDVSEDQWFFEAAVELYYEGIMVGVDETHFNPAGTLTRAEWVTMLYRAAGSPAVTEPCTFTDVPADSFFADAFAWAEDNGIVKGVGGSLADPYTTITREQMVTILFRYAGDNGVTADLSAYTDAEEVSRFAVEAMAWAVGNGCIKGMTATTLAPKATTNRAQAATFLARWLDLI